MPTRHFVPSGHAGQILWHCSQQFREFGTLARTKCAAIVHLIKGNWNGIPLAFCARSRFQVCVVTGILPVRGSRCIIRQLVQFDAGKNIRVAHCRRLHPIVAAAQQLLQSRRDPKVISRLVLTSGANSTKKSAPLQSGLKSPTRAAVLNTSNQHTLQHLKI
jgi:hypothetical protein